MTAVDWDDNCYDNFFKLLLLIFYITLYHHYHQHQHHHDPWAQSLYTIRVQCIFCNQFPCLSCASILSLCTSVWHQSLMSAIHSLHGFPCLPVPSIIHIMTSFIFLLFSILPTCQNNPSFLLITACIKSFLMLAFSWSLSFSESSLYYLYMCNNNFIISNFYD